MKLNNISPSEGSTKVARRVGRGIGSGLGKTCGRGHKGQKSRSGGFHKIGFEGGQMPLQRRLPKVGFRSRKSLWHKEIRLSELNIVKGDMVTLLTLIDSGIVPGNTKSAKVVLSGELTRAVNVVGISVTKGAAAAIEAAGGKVGG